MPSLPSLMAPTSAMFLVPESREQPMHVGGLQLFQTPPGADRDYLSGLFQDVIRTPAEQVAPLFRRVPHRGVTTLGQWSWVDDHEIDLEHHVRHSALPRPGRIRELLALTSRLHSTLLDRQRPLWETHLIEGLDDGRFAVYTKLHHAVMDGVSAMRTLENSLSTDPEARDVPPPFAPRSPAYPRDDEADGPSALQAGWNTLTDAVGIGPKLAQFGMRSLRGGSAVVPMQAPHSMLNVPITGSRRFAADRWELDRIRAVGKAAGATINDVVLTMCSSALRDYLLSQDALPDASLVSMTPVSIRTGDADAGGNAVGSILCSLATDLDDEEARLLSVRDSMQEAKAALAGMSPLQITAISAAINAPLLLNSALDLHRFVRPAFNLTISNVPGPRDPLYWNGARLDGQYPLSIPLNGQALNITVTSYAGHLNFGLTACRRSLPHMQQMLHGLDEALMGLEKAFLST